MTLSVPKNPNASKEEKAKQLREAANQEKAAKQLAAGAAPVMKYINPEDCSEKIRIIADDSGSMSGEPWGQAKKGIVEFLRNCVPNQTAVGVSFFNGHEGGIYESRKEAYKNLASLQTNLLLLATAVEDAPFHGGGTPLFSACMRVIALAPFATRYVLFSDGSPSESLRKEYVSWSEREAEPFDKYSADIVCNAAIERKSPIDTVFFGGEYNKTEIALMKYIADRTGGYFLHFDPAKVNFGQAFKYLAPVNRFMLASESVRKEIESGKRT